MKERRFAMQKAKQPYQAPELKEWGAVAELTQVANGTSDVYCGSVVRGCPA